MLREPGVVPNAGPFSIQRLEVSRFGSWPLWVLNGCVGGRETEIGRDERVDPTALGHLGRAQNVFLLPAGAVLGLASPRTRDSR
jgi:hypothetical protein